ncbi:MAG: threonine/serine exporter family protein [Clostridium sp.]|uniref:threonine/serine exporter family protein n=1 Tax=Clostridium sp. TaxID=1506 RepID=UPI003F356F2A
MRDILFQTFLAFISTIGFGIIFNIKGRNLIFSSIAGGLSWFMYKFCLLFNPSVTFAMFISAVCFSIYSEILARKLKTPVTTLIISALIPLVPGSGMYYTMYAAVSGDTIKALNLSIDTLSSAGALAIGILFVSTITRYYYIQKNKKTLKIRKKSKPL